jgi:ATP-dependent Lon protease
MTATKWTTIDLTADQSALDEFELELPELMLLPIVTRKPAAGAPNGGAEGEAAPGETPIPDTLAILPLRGVVVYPLTAVPLTVGQQRSVKLVDEAAAGQRIIGLVTSKNPELETPMPEDLYSFGTAVAVHRLFRAPDGTIRLLVQGLGRFRTVAYTETEPFLKAKIELVPETLEDDVEVEALRRTVSDQYTRIAELAPSIPQEMLQSILNVEDPRQLVYSVATYQRMDLGQAQELLEIDSVKEKLRKLAALLAKELEVLEIGRKIQSEAQSEMEKMQRDYYLREQMKAIQRELGDKDEQAVEVEEFKKKIAEAEMPEEPLKQANRELDRLSKLPTSAAEYGVIRTYLDWLTALPWGTATTDNLDVKHARQVLDEDHYGLDDIKERILEYLAVQQRVKKLKGPILCLVGPPGVGKTSLGRSIARATNRKFVRMSLGGVRDEAEIRGHRRTYIGSMPGKILQSMAKVGAKNPLMLLDEIDKMAMDFRGDPASALLEVLDPEQNHAFNDHYLEVDYDLSEVMFVTTANSLNIPPALLDRMEVIRLSGYTEDEKVSIAQKYLIPKQMERNGLKAEELVLKEQTIRDIIRYYTREAGVRNLEREIANICRKVVKNLLKAPDTSKMTVAPKQLEKLIGVRRFRFGRADEQDRIGQVTGLAWTEVGGDLLTIEAAVVRGKGKATSTGHLGDVMKESIEAAMTVVRSRCNVLGIDPDFYRDHDFHIHVPEGATPKDGPSAGVAMCTALVSALTGIPVKSTVAMTGEITLRGEVLPIGGLKEKLLAALRGGIETVLIPRENEPQLVDIPKNIKQGLDIRAVRWIDEVLAVALQRAPEPRPATDEAAKVVKKDEAASETDQDVLRTH